MSNSDFASAQSTSFEKIPIIDISDIHTESGFEKIATELVHVARINRFFLYKRA